MQSTTKPVARALAYRWGELQEEPPEFIDDLMVDLATERLAAQRTGDETRVECLGELLDILAEGIVKYEHPDGPNLDGDVLADAIAGVRTYYYLQSGGLGAEGRSAGVLDEEQLPRRRITPAL